MTTRLTTPTRGSTRASKKAKRRRIAQASGYYVFGGGLAVMFAVPIVWSVLRSLQSKEVARKGLSWSTLGDLTIQNYLRLRGAGAGFHNYAMNSFVVALATTVGSVIIATMAGYALARTNFPGRNIVFVAILVPFMVPFQGILVPLFSVLDALQLTNSLVGLIIVYLTFQMPFSVFVMRNTFLAVPTELEEAALIDGASTFQIMRRIFFPLVLPGIATVALYAFLYGWSEFLAALIYINTDRKLTLPVALANLQTSAYGEIDLGLLEAGAVFSMIPCLVLFLFLQRYYLRGLAAGSMKF
ncbi:MAG: carbohydrate ABC transporter permease [Bifidobacteriaceae bacterium]|jgi:multiple sugar transport system permease protein|nr:carbohydrate ABC transporter permease [Bifidobacteriaceae bacterium]